MILVVAWDGADYDLLAPWLAAGDLPNLAAAMKSGASRRLASTVPPVTFPAWTSFMTGASPGYHGLTDFTVREPGDYRVRFVNATYRRLPTVWRLMSEAGLRVGVYGFPATFPAEELNGVQVCGFDTPFGVSAAARATHPAGLAESINKRWGDLAVRGPSQSTIDSDWHERVAAELVATAELRTEIVMDLMREQAFDVFAVHFSESDTVSHHFWNLCDSVSPRHRPSGQADSMRSVYRALDRALGRLMEAAGPDADLLLVSDHGSGGNSDRGVCWNRWLADAGYLRFRPDAAGLSQLASRLRSLAIKVVPAAWQARLFANLGSTAARLESRHRFAGIDWAGTRAFSEELNYQAGIWLNLKGRERDGVVPEQDAKQVLTDLTRDLLSFVDPMDGRPVVREVHRRESVLKGPFADRAPDLLLDLHAPDGYSYCGLSSRGGRERSSVRRLSQAEMSGARGTSMSGGHRPFGMALLAGPRAVSGRFPDSDLPDAGATLLALAGLSAPDPADGRPWGEGVHLGPLRPACGVEVEAETPYGGDDDADVVRRLRDLGYLD